VRALRTVPCFTCGRKPTDIFADGSPRYDHGHDATTGETWWARDDTIVGSVRRCPACRHEHAVGTTCRECEPCQALDRTADAMAAFADLLPGGADAITVLVRHDRALGRDSACDGSCGVPDCRRPDFAKAGLTRYGGRPSAEGGVLPARAETLEMPVEDDYLCQDASRRRSSGCDSSTTTQPDPPGSPVANPDGGDSG